MIERKVILDQIEITRSGHVQVRMLKAVVDNGKIVASEYHRTVVEPGADPDARLAAVNASLATMDTPWPPVAVVEWQRVRQHCTVAHTPEVVAAHKAALEAAFQPATPGALPV